VIALANQHHARVSRGSRRPNSQPMPGAFNSKGVAVVAVVVLLHTRASAQEAGDLLQQLQKLKQQYEQTTKDLQQRIAVLEQQIQKRNEAAAQQKESAEPSDKASVSAAEFAAEMPSGRSCSETQMKLARSTRGRSRRFQPMTSCRKRKRRLQAYNSSWAHSNFTDISARDTD
jgi:Tfp pilus assembly protein PilN